MTQLRLPDVDRLRRDQDSFLARVLTLGSEHARLPPRFEETLAAFLRAHALTYAQRHRRGIALGRQGMERGLTQAWACLELALEARSGGAVEHAFEPLTTTPLTRLHTEGYELAFARMEEIRVEADLLRQSKDAHLCVDLLRDLEGWCHLTPETWVLTEADGSERMHRPAQLHERFHRTRARLQFVRSFPLTARQPLRAAGATTYDALLRRLVAALALGVEDLTLEPGAVEPLRRRLTTTGSAWADQRKEIVTLIESHLPTLFSTIEERRTILEDVSQALARLEEASPDAATFRLTLCEEPVVEDSRAATRGQP